MTTPFNPRRALSELSGEFATDVTFQSISPATLIMQSRKLKSAILTGYQMSLKDFEGFVMSIPPLVKGRARLRELCPGV
jgi:hypothetical protein